MDLFNMASKVAKEVSDSMASVGSAFTNTTKEQTELANLKIQKSVLERKMESQYAEIGRKYIEYISKAFNTQPFDVQGILDEMRPNLEKLSEIEVQIAEKEKVVKANNAERDKKKAQEQFDAEKKKLDKAKEMDILTEEEYAAKLSAAQKKLENYEILRKLEMQYNMDIITKEEYEEKVRNILQ